MEMNEWTTNPKSQVYILSNCGMNVRAECNYKIGIECEVG